MRIMTNHQNFSLEQDQTLDEHLNRIQIQQPGVVKNAESYSSILRQETNNQTIERLIKQNHVRFLESYLDKCNFAFLTTYLYGQSTMLHGQ